MSEQRVVYDLLRTSFLAVVWFGSHGPSPSPLSPQQVVSLSLSTRASHVELTDGRRKWLGAKSYGREKAWPCIYQVILSGSEIVS